MDQTWSDRGSHRASDALANGMAACSLYRLRNSRFSTIVATIDRMTEVAIGT